MFFLCYIFRILIVLAIKNLNFLTFEGKFPPLRETFKRIFRAGSETATMLFFFRSLQHLTRVRVFRGLEIVYCFFASFPLLLLLALSLLYVFPHIKHFPTRALSIYTTG